MNVENSLILSWLYLSQLQRGVRMLNLFVYYRSFEGFEWMANATEAQSVNCS